MTQKIHHSNTLPQVASCNNWVAFVFDGGIFMEKPKLIEDLGQQKPTINSNYTVRFGIFECPLCGKHFRAQHRGIKRGNPASCGCYKSKLVAEKNYKHGFSHHPLFPKYKDMIRRCYDSTCRNYARYGARGISVCDEWRKGFEYFLKWDKVKDFKQGDIIDRIDNNGNYSPDNCRWADRFISGQNTRLIISSNTSGFRGVSYSKKDKTFIAMIGYNGNTHHLGSNKNPIVLAKAYNDFVIKNKTSHPLNIIPDGL